MRYVMRDAAGKIVGTFANLQPGHAEEGKPDDDAEVVAFENPPPESESDRAVAEATRNPALKGIVRLLARKFNTTPAAIVAEIKSALTE